jgi:hypothetical protein
MRDAGLSVVGHPDRTLFIGRRWENVLALRGVADRDVAREVVTSFNTITLLLRFLERSFLTFHSTNTPYHEA